MLWVTQLIRSERPSLACLCYYGVPGLWACSYKTKRLSWGLDQSTGRRLNSQQYIWRLLKLTPLTYLYIYLSVRISVCLSEYLFVCPPLCLEVGGEGYSSMTCIKLAIFLIVSIVYLDDIFQCIWNLSINNNNNNTGEWWPSWKRWTSYNKALPYY